MVVVHITVVIVAIASTTHQGLVLQEQQQRQLQQLEINVYQDQSPVTAPASAMVSLIIQAIAVTMFIVVQPRAARQHRNVQKEQCQVLAVFVLVMLILLGIAVAPISRAALYGQETRLAHRRAHRWVVSAAMALPAIA